MKFEGLPLPGSYLITPELYSDSRGAFGRIFCKEEFKKIGHHKEIVQINHSYNHRVGAIRGMHFQYPPKAEIKLVKCLKGSVYDVIIDIRQGSSTFLQWYGVELSDENMRTIYVPEGFAHGFQVLQPDSELLYFHTEFYSPGFEGALRYNDSLLSINWPEKVADISEKDKKHPLIGDDFRGLKI